MPFTALAVAVGGALITNALTDKNPGRDAANEIQAGNTSAIGGLNASLGTTEEQLSPFLDVGAPALDQLVQSSTPQGLDQRFSDIFNSDVAGGLIDRRRQIVQNQLSAGGLNRSGTALDEISRIPVDIGMQIESLLAGRSAGLAGIGQSAALNLGQFRQNNAGLVSNLTAGIGNANSQGRLLDSQVKKERVQNVVNAASFGISQTGGGGQGGGGGGGSNLAGLAGLAGQFFSDHRLKRNVKKVGDFKDLSVFAWDWIESAKGTIIEKCANIGFMSTQVRELYPEYISTYCGYDVIDYHSLLNKLEAV